jgi:uncharacterized membrane protein YidH (DUF202 family)
MTQKSISDCFTDLANERTFLAWLRTGLGSVGLGILFAKLVQTTSFFVLGMCLVILGILYNVYGGYRYVDRVSITLL